MNPLNIYAANIEWSADAGVVPDMFTAEDNIDLLQPAVVSSLRDSLDDDGYEDDLDFISDNPYPDLADVPAMRTWIAAMREATTVPWVEFYRLEQEDNGVRRGMPLDLRDEVSAQ